MVEQTAAPEVIKNCPSCKKLLRRAKKYYRNGVYYCNKNCWKKHTQASANPKE